MFTTAGAAALAKSRPSAPAVTAPLAPNAAERRLQDASCLLDEHALAHATHDPKPVELIVAERPRVVARVGHPDVGWTAGLDAAERRFADADDFEWTAV